MKPLPACHLYTFVDSAYLHGRAPGEIARSLCEGGSDIIQLRAKGWTVDEVRRVVSKILPITQSAHVHLVVNDHPAVAREFPGLLCHLGQEDFFDAGFTHTSQLSTSQPRLPIGLSTHAPDQAERALAADPAYIAIGPVFATPTKPGRPAVTLDYVRWAAAHVRIPWFAIGGITLENLDAVIATGATRVCVVSAILSASDITKACQQFARRLTSARNQIDP